MIGAGRRVRVYAATCPTDLRKSFDTLAHLVTSELGQDPLSGDASALRALAGRPFVLGPHINVYSQPALQEHAGLGAVRWVEGTLLGTVATVVAVIAVAWVGFMMLTGRINWRHGAVVILGCFILFGAASIVAGIQQAAGGY